MSFSRNNDNNNSDSFFSTSSTISVEPCDNTATTSTLPLPLLAQPPKHPRSLLTHSNFFPGETAHRSLTPLIAAELPRSRSDSDLLKNDEGEPIHTPGI